MNDESSQRSRIPSGERLYSLLAVIAIVVIVLAYLFFINISILPAAKARQEHADQLSRAEQTLMEAQRAQNETPNQLRTQIASTQEALDQAANKFLNESQAASILDKLSEYADASRVQIFNLETLPSPEKQSDVYDVRKFQLETAGSLPLLINFVSRIQEATNQSLVINNVNITEGEETHTLAMDVTLYTSPYASETAPQPTAAATPPPDNLTQLDEALTLAWSAEDWKRAISLIQEIRAIDPSYDDMLEKLYVAYVNYGHQLLKQGDANGAITQFNGALSVKPKGTEALAGLQQAVATPAPTLTVEQELIGNLDKAWATEDWQAVLDLIEQILELNPDNPNMLEKLYAAHVNYGYRLAAEGQLEQAKEEFIRALDIEPKGEQAIAGLQTLAKGGIPAPPAPPPPQPEPQYVTHVVQRNDTLYSISRRYNTTVQAIMTANGLTNYNIHAGQELRIPTSP